MKKKILVSFLFLPLLITSAFIKAHTNKTFLMPRSQLDNMALELSSWHTQFMTTDNHKFAGTIQATPYYQKSDNKSDLGRYFGYHAEYEEVTRDFISIAKFEEVADLNFDSDDIPVLYFIHDPDLDSLGNFGGKIKFKPNQEVYGVRLDYFQNLGRFFFKADLPIVEVENSVEPSRIGQVPLVKIYETTGLPETDRAYNLFDYFAGKIQNLNTTDENLKERQQKELKKAKFHGGKRECGVADINVALGYTFLHKKNCRMDFAINTTIPTGNKADGEYLFEPIVGAGGHWGLGAQIDSKLRLWEEKHSRDAIDFLLFANLKYLFEETEKRTLGLLNNQGEHINFGQYYLGGKKDEFPLFPLANVLTRDLKIRPGLQFELLTALAFNANNVTFDLGYNLFLKHSEKVFLKDEWPENTYAIANTGDANNPGYFTTEAPVDAEFPVDEFYGPFDPTSQYHYDQHTIPGPIQERNLDIGSVRTPSQFTNKVYGALSYAFYEWKYPMMLGLGTSYEFNGGSTALENLTLWVKGSVLF